MSLFNYEFMDFFNLTGGINTVKSAIQLGPNEARDAQNVDLFPIGGASKRNGYLQLNSNAVSANACTGLYMARYMEDGGSNLAYLFNGPKVYKMGASLGGTWTDITGSLTITAGANNIWNIDMLNDVVACGNGIDAPINLDADGVASALFTAQAITNFKFPVQFRGYMFYFVPTVSGVVQYDTVYFSDLNTPTTVGANNFINVAKGHGGTIQGVVEYKTYLYVFKRQGIYQINYQPTRVNSSGALFPFTESPNPVVPGVGTQSHRSIVKFTTPETHPTPGQELVFFVDQYGVPRIFDGATTISFASKIGFSRDPNILSLSDMDQSRNPYSFSINYPAKNRILCFMSDANSQQDTCWVLDYASGFSIMRYDFASAFNVGTLFETAAGLFKPYVGDYVGKVHQLDQGNDDNGIAINDYYVTGDTFKGSPSLKSKWYFMDGRGKTGSSTQKIKFSYFIDGSDFPTLSDSKSFQEAETIWGAFTWGVDSWSTRAVTNVTSEINVESKTMRVKFESLDKLNDTYNLEGFSLASSVLGTQQN